jgi:hypothetical protein
MKTNVTNTANKKITEKITNKLISKKSCIPSIIVMAIASQSGQVLANEAKATADFRLRFESVNQDNTKKDAEAFTLRTRVNFATKSYSGFSGFIEFEDSRVVAGVDDYNNTLGKSTQYSVIADPETTELDQGFLQYKNKVITAKIGRQVITLDGHRFIGHVGWRQDKQTFDATSIAYTPNKKTKVTYAYVNQRNRIFAQEKDFDSKDHLINASYQTSYGKFVAYGYLLEIDEGADNSLDSYGASFVGKRGNFSYAIEYATQSSETDTTDYTATYLMAEAGYSFKGLTTKVGVEKLGSDDGLYAFSTPLATLHKFNGWSDQFLGTPKEGLVDIYASIAGKVLGGKWLVSYHDFSADESSTSIDDFGSEINAVYSKSFMKNYSAGIKFAAYSGGDSGAGKVDTDKVWLWIGAKF